VRPTQHAPWTWGSTGRTGMDGNHNESSKAADNSVGRANTAEDKLGIARKNALMGGMIDRLAGSAPGEQCGTRWWDWADGTEKDHFRITEYQM